MEKFLTKEQILYFTTALIVCTILGYLSRDLKNGVFTGIFIGAGFVTGMSLMGKRRK